MMGGIYETHSHDKWLNNCFALLWRNNVKKQKKFHACAAAGGKKLMAVVFIVINSRQQPYGKIIVRMHQISAKILSQTEELYELLEKTGTLSEGLIMFIIELSKYLKNRET